MKQESNDLVDRLMELPYNDQCNFIRDLMRSEVRENFNELLKYRCKLLAVARTIENRLFRHARLQEEESDNILIADEKVEFYLKELCRKYKIEEEDLLHRRRGPRRKGSYNDRVYMAYIEACITFRGDGFVLSYAEIGRIFGRDHSTIINAVKKS